MLTVLLLQLRFGKGYFYFSNSKSRLSIFIQDENQGLLKGYSISENKKNKAIMDQKITFSNRFSMNTEKNFTTTTEQSLVSWAVYRQVYAK